MSYIQVQFFLLSSTTLQILSSFVYVCILPTVLPICRLTWKEPVARLCTWMTRQCSSLLFLNRKDIVRRASQGEPGA